MSPSKLNKRTASRLMGSVARNNGVLTSRASPVQEAKQVGIINYTGHIVNWGICCNMIGLIMYNLAIGALTQPSWAGWIPDGITTGVGSITGATVGEGGSIWFTTNQLSNWQVLTEKKEIRWVKRNKDKLQKICEVRIPPHSWERT